MSEHTNVVDSSPTNHDSNPWQTIAVQVKRVIAETPGVKTYDLEPVDPNHGTLRSFAAGQFNMLYVPGVGEAAISISGKPDPNAIRHTIRDVGSVTHALDRGSVGMQLGLRGPFGTAWPMEQILQSPDPSHVIIVAGGIGLAPLRCAITEFIRHRASLERVDILIGARSPNDLLYASEYAAWQQSGVSVQSTVDRSGDGWRGNVGVVTLLLDRLSVPRPESTFVLSCGPEVMMRYVLQAAIQRQIPMSQLWLAMERNMNCAIGLCGHCQIGPSFVCKDGPIFRYDQVISLLNSQGL
ncbi:MAG: FAD/NAD(P)-binding protein [Rubripirellula sp.]